MKNHMRIITVLLFAGIALFISACSGEGYDNGNTVNTTPEVNPSIVGDAATGKSQYENKLCYACHGNNALGGPSGMSVQGKTGADIMQTMTIHLVHSGITLDEQNAYDIAEFLLAPSGVIPPATADFS